MTQTGIVTDIKGDMATVNVMRSGACDACHAKDFCLNCKKTAKAKAYNEAGAQVGDTVELSTPSGTVLGYAAAVFLFPIVMALASYLISREFVGEMYSYLVSLGFFAVAFVIIYFVFNRPAAKKKNTVTVVKIINKDIQ